MRPSHPCDAILGKEIEVDSPLLPTPSEDTFPVLTHKPLDMACDIASDALEFSSDVIVAHEPTPSSKFSSYEHDLATLYRFSAEIVPSALLATPPAIPHDSFSMLNMPYSTINTDFR